jgi:N-acetylglucosaminyldiphosphoundecaprenol N-acetyl-beta-D-mannosaminyltransferase
VGRIAKTAAERVNIGGVGVSPIDIPFAVSTIEDWIGRQSQNYICVCGAHGVMECRSNSRFKTIHDNAGLVVPDGMPLVWMARSLGYTGTTRVYGPDLMLAVSEVSAAKGYKQFYYGGNDGIADKLKQSLTSRFNGLDVVGTYTPPFRKLTDAEDAEIVDRINAANPDIVWVGLSTPKQELWMSEHVGRIKAPVMIGVGAAFDFHSGAKVQAPGWVRNNGFEWAFRLATEPKRLWRRYMVIVPGFAAIAAAQLVRERIGGARNASAPPV